MDYCLDPTILEEHSLFLYGHPQPVRRLPLRLAVPVLIGLTLSLRGPPRTS